MIGGKIRDCNRPMLKAALSEHDFNATDLGVAADKLVLKYFSVRLVTFLCIFQSRYITNLLQECT